MPGGVAGAWKLQPLCRSGPSASTSLPNDPIGDGRYAVNGKVYVFCPLKSEPLTDLSQLNNNPARVIIKIVR
jgi:hypothetical protein